MCRELKRPFEKLGADDKALVFDFVGYFSRMEYSMKRAGCIKPNTNKVEVSWDVFIERNQHAFQNCDLNELCPTLYNDPPKNLVFDENGEVCWQDVPPEGSAVSLLTLSLSLRRVRNNLFHGGKYHGDGVHGFDRSSDLLREGIDLIKHMALMDEGVKHFWNYD